jgi:hypothetical protein
VDGVQLSADDLARLAEVEPAFVQRAMQAGALKHQEPAGGFGTEDAARLRFLKAWDAAGLRVEAIGDLIAKGELPFSFMDVPVMAAQPRLPSTYQELCAEQGIELTTVRRLHDALGFTPPAASDTSAKRIQSSSSCSNGWSRPAPRRPLPCGSSAPMPMPCAG